MWPGGQNGQEVTVSCADIPVSVRDEDVEERYPSLFVGPALRAARLRASVSQGEIARRFSIDSSIPSRWEGYDSSTNSRTSRYKPVPYKYLRPLAAMLNVTVSDLAPDLMEVIEPPPGGCTAAAPNTTTVSYWQQGAAFTVTGGSEQMSAYTLGGGGLTPTPAPGRPPESFQQTHSWRRWCPGCHKEYIESSTSRAPLICDACGGPVRASVQVTVTKTQ